MFSDTIKNSNKNEEKVHLDSSVNQELMILQDKISKYKKESKRLKEQIFTLKRDFDLKLNNTKRKHKLDIDGYKQEWQLKEKDIDRLKKEIEKYTVILNNKIFKHKK